MTNKRSRMGRRFVDKKIWTAIAELHGSIKGAADQLHKLRGENNRLKTELEEVSRITKRHEERIEGMRGWAREMDARA
jgi:hypothetical protein